MNALLLLLSLVLGVAIAVFVPTYGAPAVLVGALFAGIAVILIGRVKEHKQFLLRMFIGALLIRILVGTLIFTLHLQEFFGGDAITYDAFGYALLRGWGGDHYYSSLANQYVGGVSAGGGWGMLYVVAAVYSVIGRNLLAVQYVNAVIGALTAPVIFLCAHHMFDNSKVARIAGLFVAFYPSLVLWSSQGLKDGPIVFLLAISMLATLKLGEKLTIKFLAVLVCALFGLLSLRFYVFYMMVAAAGGSFIIGMRAITAQSFIRQFILVIAIGLSLTYLGVLRYASVQSETFGNLRAVELSRLDASQSAKSGFGKDVDVSTTSGAITAIPLGMMYLLFAPFPWELASLRQSITLPEMIVWWSAFPLLVLGLLFTLRYRLRQALPILIFTSMLTLVYSLFQGNVGNAYRQRSQLLVFYFIFVAVGAILIKEKIEDRRRRELTIKQTAGTGTFAPRSSSNI